MSSNDRELHTTAEASHEGTRLDRFLGGLLRPDYSRSYLVQLIRAGHVTVNGVKEKPSYRVEPGDRIDASLGPPPHLAPQPENIPLDVLYQDEDLLVIDKPAGLLVHPVEGSRRGGTLVNALLWHFPRVEGVGTVERPGIVHRLDRYTSGVMVVALSNRARTGMLAQFKERTLKKDYLAIVVGKVPLHSDYIDLPIGKDPRRSERMRIDVAGGKSSSTFYEVLERLPGHTVLRAVPLTGRTHQIRVHLAHLGFPVLLDSTYGRAQAHLFQRACRQWMEEGLAAPSLDRQALHARRIAFVHPVDGRTLEFEAPVPRDLQEVIEFLRRQRE